MDVAEYFEDDSGEPRLLDDASARLDRDYEIAAERLREFVRKTDAMHDACMQIARAGTMAFKEAEDAFREVVRQFSRVTVPQWNAARREFDRENSPAPHRRRSRLPYEVRRR